MADERNVGVPPTVVKAKTIPAGYTGASGFLAMTVSITLIGSIAYFSYASIAGSQHAASVQVPQQIPHTQPSAAPVPDPTNTPTPAPRSSVRVETTVRAYAVTSPAHVAPAPLSVVASRSVPSMSPADQYQQEEAARTLASQRASSLVKFSQDDQAREDLADVGAEERPAAVRPAPAKAQAIPLPSSTSLFASDDVNGSSADQFVAQHRTASVGYVAPVSSDQVDAGTYIQAVTSSAVDSTFPDGTIRSMITSPVFSSTHGHTVVVIPQGTELLVTYNAHPAQGTARLQSVGTRLVFEDGHEFNLGGSSQAAGMQGEAGMSASVDTHAGKAFGNAVLAAVLQAGIGLSSRATTNVNVGSALPQPAQLPTMHVKPGTPFTFVIAEDLPLKRVTQ